MTGPGSAETTECLIVGCGGAVFSRGWCQRHYTRWLRHGDPGTVRVARSAYDRIMTRAVRVADCLEFYGAPSAGYGMIRDGTRMRRASRVVMEHHHGPSELHVLHSCDNPPCVEIEHLRYGTPAENVADRDERNGSYPIGNQWGTGWERQTPEGRRKYMREYMRKRRADERRSHDGG